MKKALLSLLALVSTFVCHAQQVGDSEAAVVKELGTTQMMRTSGDRRIWVYPNGTKIVFKGGVVVEAKIAPPKPTSAVDDLSLPPPAGSHAETSPTNANRSGTAAYSSPKTAPVEATTAGSTDAARTKLGRSAGPALVLMIAGYGLMIVCWLIVVVKAFGESVLWGIAVLIVPFAYIIFVATHWAETKAPFITGLIGGIALFILAAMVGAM